MGRWLFECPEGARYLPSDPPSELWCGSIHIQLSDTNARISGMTDLVAARGESFYPQLDG